MNGLTLTGAMDPRGRTTQQALEVPKGASSPYALPSQPNPTWMQGSEMDDWLHDPKDADKVSLGIRILRNFFLSYTLFANLFYRCLPIFPAWICFLQWFSNQRIP